MERLKAAAPLAGTAFVILFLIGLQSWLRFSAVSGRSQRIVMWHSYIGKEETVLKEIVAKYNADPALNQGYKIEILSVSFGNFPDKLTNSLPRGQGPDIFIYAHDRLDDWHSKGLLAPMDFWADKDLLGDLTPPQTVDAFIKKNRLYGIPLTAKNLALYYRTLPDGTSPEQEIRALMKTGKWDIKNFKELAKKYTRKCPWNSSLKCYGLGYMADDAYHHAPWLHASGGRFVSEDGKIQIKTPEAIDAAKIAWDLAGDHAGAVCPPELSYPLMSDLFNRGEIAMVISGPWFMSQIDMKKVKFSVTDLPSSQGRYAAPFLTIEGIYMSSRAANPEAAFRAIRYLTGEASAELRARNAGQMPVIKTVQNRMRGECITNRECPFGKFHYEDFYRIANKSIVMPSSAEARILWSPYTKALAAIVRRNVKPEKALAEAAWETEKYLGACLRRGK